MVANFEQNLVHLLDSMVHHCRTVNGGKCKTMMGEERGRRKIERRRTLLVRCAYSAYRFPVQFGQLQKAITPHLW